MANDKIKTIVTRRSIDMDKFLETIIKKVKDEGCNLPLKKVHIERLLLKHRLANDIASDIIVGFRGIRKVNPQVENWMRGKHAE